MVSPTKKNTHFWAIENPHIVNEIQNQGHFGVNVWCGIIGRHLIGPYFYEGVLNGEVYLNFLVNHLPGLLENVPLQLRRNMFLQQDGAPPHNCRIVFDYLNTHFPNHWIGTHGPVSWPPQSPDLTPDDFFLWGTLKNSVYKSRCNNIEELKQKIIDACNNISVDTLYAVTNREVRRRLEKCQQAFGGHIENIL